MSDLVFSYRYEPRPKQEGWRRRSASDWTGKHVFTCKSHIDYTISAAILQWCKANVGPIKEAFQFSPYFRAPDLTVAFFNDGDALAFRMRWVGKIMEEKA